MDVVAATESLSFAQNGPAMLLLGMGALAAMYLAVRPRKKKDPLESGGPLRSSLASQKALERDMQSVIVELHELTRQMSAQLETRSAKLELLIRDADERVARLNEANDAAMRIAPSPAAAPSLPTSEVAAEPVRAMRLVQDSEDRWNDVYHHADAGATIADICRTLNRPRGEVELILALRPKARAAAVG